MDIASLTQSEATARAALLDVTGYEIEVDLTDLLAGPAVRCVSTVTFACRQPGAETFVDCVADVLSATLNGVALERPAQGRLRLTDLKAGNVLRVESVQTDTEHGQGAHKSVDPADGEVYLWMSFEPDQARYVWACFDQPDLKAPHAFTVTAPAHWTVLSNAGDAEVNESGDGRRWTFPPTPPLSPYNTVIDAGPFHEIRRHVDGYDLGVLARRSLSTLANRDADEIFTLTSQGLRFFGDAFGMPFPQAKLDHVFVPDLGGAMENYGCITWGDVMLRRSAPTQAENDQLALYLLHELAHMWFGNIVTMRWWDDLWLNEAFAEFASNWAAERATAYTDAWTVHLAGPKRAAYQLDQGPRAHPIREPVHDVAQAGSNFDAITYYKGASVLQQLMAYVGEEAFGRGMRAYFAEHAWSSTTLQDLIDALAASSGRDLDPWRTAWLERAGTDRFTLEQGAHGLELVADGLDEPRPQLVQVGAYRRGDDGLVRVALAPVEPAGRRTVVDLAPGADLYLGNDDDLTYATVAPDAASTQALLEAAAELPTAISRGIAVTTVWDLMFTGRVTASEVVGSLTRVLLAERTPSMVEPLLGLAADAAELWAADAERGDLLATVAEACRRLAADGDRRRVALRGLSRCTRDLAEVDWVRRQAGDDLDLHWRALRRQAELGAETGPEASRLQSRDPDPDAWLQALAVDAAAPTPSAKEAVWQALAVDRTVPLGSFLLLAEVFWRPGQDGLLAPYGQAYLDHLPGLQGLDSMTAGVSASRLYPLFGVDLAYVDRSTSAASRMEPAIRDALTARADLVTRMLRSRSGAVTR